MPNHVYNTLTIEAKNQEDLDAFLQKAKHEDREFSFWNFVTPPQEALDSGEYHAIHGFVEGKDSGNTHNNWYNFNNREWGTKWDAYDVDVLRDVPNQPSYLFAFTTAWAHPYPVFVAITEQHPELEFEFTWQEEQGWGGEAIGVGGVFSITKEYEIPESHADYEETDNLFGCICQSESDQKYWYEDCPKEEEPASELEQKIRTKIIEGSGVTQEWADKHLIVMGLS
jgi:hypothetical protein